MPESHEHLEATHHVGPVRLVYADRHDTHRSDGLGASGHKKVETLGSVDAALARIVELGDACVFPRLTTAEGRPLLDTPEIERRIEERFGRQARG